MARAGSRSASLKTYWRTVHAVAARLDKPIKAARAVVREGRSRELTHTALRKITPQRAGALLKSDRAKAPARFKLQRQRDVKRALRLGRSFDFGANMPAPTVRERSPQAQRAIDVQEEPDEDVIDDLYDFIEEYDDAEDYDEPIDVEVTPSYKGRGK